MIYTMTILKKDITPCMVPLTEIPPNALIYLDGGYILRKYIWSDDDTFQHYSCDTNVVFDGYDSAMSTKRAEQKRRAAKGTAKDVLFAAHMKPNT